MYLASCENYENFNLDPNFNPTLILESKRKGGLF